MTIPQAFQIAFQHHQAGRLADAETLYRQILAVQPNHADALHLLGVVAHQTGRHEVAVDWISRAIVLNPNNPAAHSNLGEAYRAMGRLDEAIAAFRGAIQLKPDYPEAHSNLGAALARRDHLDEAIAAFRRALELKPDYPEAYSNLGAALARHGHLDKAADAFQNALKLRPDYPDAHNNLGHVLRELGQLDDAIAACRLAVHLKSDFPEAYANLGNALRDRGHLEEAIAAYRISLQLKPDMPDSHNNLAGMLRDFGQPDEAIAECYIALQIKPDFPEAHLNLGNALRDRDQPDEAIAAYRRALELEANYPEAHANLGNALKEQGMWDESIAAYRHSVALNPGDARFESNLIYALQFHPNCDRAQIREEHQRWNRKYSEPLRHFISPHTNDRNPERRLRIGYVSPDFNDHVVGRNLVPLFQCHDRRNFEIVCYSGVVREDKSTDEFQRCAHQWRATVGVSDEALAEMIRRDGVDILVDLTQHMAGNRLPAFARKPAPVQVSFAGYPDSTGLEAIEYRISDRHLEGASGDEAPEKKEQVHLIDSFWCYDPCGMDVAVNPLPASKNTTVTFGCLNNFCKVNERELNLWARALMRVKNSCLIMRSPPGSCRRRTLDIFQREGVAAERVEFVGFRPRLGYLELYHRLDIVLDTFPYNGHTTSLDALWMGVPVVSLVGHARVSRAGLSQLTNLGLPQLASRSEAEYVNIAANLAGDLPRLAEFRATLRPRMQASPLMDAPRFARNVETAYRSIWRRWCLGKSPSRKQTGA